MRSPVRRLCLDAILLAFCLLLSYLEAILPLNVWLPLPGFKLGLANIVVTLMFVAVSPVDAALISLARICVMAALFGNASSFAFSFGGGLLSYAGLWILARAGRRAFGMVGVSVGCAALHNLGQLLVAAALYGSDILLGYLPMLLVAALIFGAVTGVLLELLLPNFSKLKTQYFR